MPNNGYSKTKRTISNSSLKSLKSTQVKQSPRSLDSLIQWLLSHEAIISKVVEKTVPGTLHRSYPWCRVFSSPAFGLWMDLLVGSGRGLFASEDIEDGELLIRIPGTCLINLGTLAPLQEEYPTYYSPYPGN